MASILYEKYKKEKQAQEEKKDISTKLGVNEEQVVVRKVSTFSKIIEITTELLIKLIKFLLYLVVCILASIGLTVLINGELRNMFLEILKNTFL